MKISRVQILTSNFQPPTRARAHKRTHAQTIHAHRRTHTIRAHTRTHRIPTPHTHSPYTHTTHAQTHKNTLKNVYFALIIAYLTTYVLICTKTKLHWSVLLRAVFAAVKLQSRLLWTPHFQPQPTRHVLCRKKTSFSHQLPSPQGHPHAKCSGEFRGHSAMTGLLPNVSENAVFTNPE